MHKTYISKYMYIQIYTMKETQSQEMSKEQLKLVQKMLSFIVNVFVML